MGKNTLVPVNQLKKLWVLPLSREDMRADTVHSLDTEMRDIHQKPGFMAYKKCIQLLFKSTCPTRSTAIRKGGK